MSDIALPISVQEVILLANAAQLASVPAAQGADIMAICHKLQAALNAETVEPAEA